MQRPYGLSLAIPLTLGCLFALRAEEASAAEDRERLEAQIAKAIQSGDPEGMNQALAEANKLNLSQPERERLLLRSERLAALEALDLTRRLGIEVRALEFRARLNDPAAVEQLRSWASAEGQTVPEQEKNEAQEKDPMGMPVANEAERKRQEVILANARLDQRRMAALFALARLKDDTAAALALKALAGGTRDVRLAVYTVLTADPEGGWAKLMGIVRGEHEAAAASFDARVDLASFLGQLAAPKERELMPMERSGVDAEMVALARKQNPGVLAGVVGELLKNYRHTPAEGLMMQHPLDRLLFTLRFVQQSPELLAALEGLKAKLNREEDKPFLNRLNEALAKMQEGGSKPVKPPEGF